MLMRNVIKSRCGGISTRILKSVGAGFLLFSVATSANAIAYSTVVDCEGGVCSYPNVVRLSGIKPDGGTRGTCTGSLLQAATPEKPYFIFLTAGHCTAGWQEFAAAKEINNLGVSGDVVTQSNISSFVVGGTPVKSPFYKAGNKENAFVPKYDTGVVVFPQNALDVNNMTIALRWPAMTPVVLPQDIPGGFSLKSLDRNAYFKNVGYGLSELVKFGSSNAGGLQDGLAGFGARHVAFHATFLNLTPTNMTTSQNPARGNDGACNGDSGGPSFYTLGNGQEIVVGLVNSGDSVCRATNIVSRLDIPEAQGFISCVRNASTITGVKECGITTKDFP